MERKIRSQTADVQSLDTRFRLLDDQRRRYAVTVLAERESSVSLDELATAVAARETETEAGEVSPEIAETVATTLHHVHLPKLADANAVTYDTQTGTVVPTRTSGLTRFLDGIDDDT